MNIILKRGSETALDSYTGISGELTLDTNNNQLRIQDGITKGGIKIVSDRSSTYVVETYNSGFDWYRIWNDGLIEQSSQTNYSTTGIQTINFIKPFTTTNYKVFINSISRLWSSSSDLSLVPTVQSYAGTISDPR